MASSKGSLSSFKKELDHDERSVEKAETFVKKPEVVKSGPAPPPPPTMIINEPSRLDADKAAKSNEAALLVPTKPAKKTKSKINFTPDTNDNEDDVLNDEEEEAHRAKMLLRSRRQSRGGGAEIKMEVKVVEQDQKAKMAQVTQKITQKIQVNNLIRSMKMTEMEKFSKNPAHLAYLNRVCDETKREINASLQEQMMRETLETLLITMESYRRDLGINHPVMENIEERINYIEDVLETQEFNRVTEAKNFIQKIAEKARTSKLPTSNRNASQLSFFAGPWLTTDEHTQDEMNSFRRSYANTNTLAPSTFVITTVCIVCALLSAIFVYHNPPS